jgi:cytochrome c peroxidase
MKHSMKTLMVAAAVSGMLSGAATMQAATSQTTNPVVKVGKASFSGVSLDKPAKHSCKGKNDCKGQGGCKSSDAGCKAKNSCKGKGGCATDGSKMPS